MKPELQALLSTVAGEALTSSPAAWACVASCILNRVGVREWAKYKTPLAVLDSGFDAYRDRNAPYKAAWTYFNIARPAVRDKRLDALRAAVEPLYNEWLAIKRTLYPRIVMYYSPKAQAALHEQQPMKYQHAIPAWAESPLVERILVAGTQGDDFAWFGYKEAA